MRTHTPFHFYASSVGEWKVSNDIGELIATMKKDRLDFVLWKVPGDKSIPYQIKYFTPMIDGRVYLGQYQRDDRGKWTLNCSEVKP